MTIHLGGCQFLYIAGSHCVCCACCWYVPSLMLVVYFLFSTLNPPKRLYHQNSQTPNISKTLPPKSKTNYTSQNPYPTQPNQQINEPQAQTNLKPTQPTRNQPQNQKNIINPNQPKQHEAQPVNPIHQGHSFPRPGACCANGSRTTWPCVPRPGSPAQWNASRAASVAMHPRRLEGEVICFGPFGVGICTFFFVRKGFVFCFRCSDCSDCLWRLLSRI